MAGDWIKVEHVTPDKPEVVAISVATGLDQDAVVGKLLRLWIWADQQSVDGNDIKVPETFIDRIVFHSGFASALRKVGWLDGREGRLSIPNFSRHGGQSAKKRATASDRQSKSRNARKIEAMSQDVTSVSQKSNIPRPLRSKVYRRDAHTCQYCGRHKDDEKPLAGPLVGLCSMSIDHVIPESKGGETVEKNLVTACLACNLEKSGRTPQEAGMSLPVSHECHTHSVTNAQPEKRREEKRKSISERKGVVVPESLDSQEFRETWELYRSWWLSNTGKRLDDIRALQQLGILRDRGSPEKAIADLKLTMASSTKPGTIWDSGRQTGRNGEPKRKRRSVAEMLEDS